MAPPDASEPLLVRVDLATGRLAVLGAHHVDDVPEPRLELGPRLRLDALPALVQVARDVVDEPLDVQEGLGRLEVGEAERLRGRPRRRPEERLERLLEEPRLEPRPVRVGA